MNRWGIFFGVAIVMLGAFVYVNVPSTIVDWTGHEVVTVRLTDEGFQPKEIYVNKDTTVTFQNDTETHFWPASDLHPFHTIYSEFDPREPIGPGGTWSFRFDKEGRWNYHDHIGLQTGAIIVLPTGVDGSYEFQVSDTCDQEDPDLRGSCYKQRIVDVLKEDGTDAAFDELKDVYNSYPEFRKDCHFFAHDLGLLSFQAYGDVTPETDKTVYCGQGFYHGFMEGFLVQHDGDTKRALAFCENEARRFGDTRPLAGPQCIHGIGHGIMEYLLSTRLDLVSELDVLVGMGVDHCAMVGDYDAQFRCASGVYAVTKDWVNIQNLQEEYGHLFSLEDPFALCRHVQEDWQQAACAWEMAKQVFVLAGNDSATAFTSEIRAGRTWQDGAYLPLAVASTAFLIGEISIERSDEETAAECSSIRDASLRLSCVEGITQGLVFNAAPGAETDRPARFCLYEGHSAEEKDACAKILLTELTSNYGDSIRKTVCSAVSHVLLDPKVCN